METRWLVVVAVLLCLAPFVSAVPVAVLQGTDCGFTSTTPLTCSNSVYAQCNVTDTNGGSPLVEVTSTDFTINGRLHPAQLISGSTTSGIWRATVNLTYGASAMNIDKVQLRNSIGWVCQFAPSVTNPIYQGSPGDPYSCYITFQGKPLSVAGNCSCETTVTVSQVVGSPNQCTTTWTPSSGCVGGTAYSSVSYCDWCDPDWAVSYNACVADRNGANPFLGLATKKYTALNTTCCDLTGLDEDCNPPADADNKVACVQDFWSTGGGDTVTSNRGQHGNSLNSPTVYSISTDAVRLSPNGSVLKPLVFDIEGDGRTEMMVFETLGGNSRVKVFDNPRLTAYSYTFIPVLGGTDLTLWKGQPSLTGFSVWGDRQYAWDPNVKSNAVGIGFAAVVQNTANNLYYFGSWRREGSGFVLKTSTALGTASPGAGVTCFVNDCYFMANDGSIKYFDALGVNGTYGVSAGTKAAGVSAGSLSLDSLPSLISFDNALAGPTALAVEGVGSGSVAAVFICPMNITSGQACTQFTVTGVDPGKVSKIVSTGVANGLVSLHFTTLQGTTSRLWKVVVNSSLSVVDSSSVVLSSIGGSNVCVSDPALANCIGGTAGVAVVSRWALPTGNSSGYNEYSCYVDGTTKSYGWTEREEYCPQNIVAQEISGDSASAIISPSGIFQYNQRVAQMSGATNQSTVIVADLTSSTYTGITTLSETTLRNIVSAIPENQITTTDSLTVDKAVCKFDPVSKTVSVTAYGITAPRKEWVEFQGSYVVSENGRSSSDITSKNPTRVLTAPVDGNYVMTVRVRDTFSGTTVEKSCEVGVDVPDVVQVASACTLGENNVDGEFNYVDSVANHGWVFGAGTKVTNSESRYITFSQSPGYQGQIFHPMACNDQRIRLEARVRPPIDASDVGDSRISILARSSVSTSSTIVPVGMVTITRQATLPYVIVIAEGFSNRTVVFTGNSTSINWLKIGISVDRITGRFQVDVAEERSNGTVQGQAYTVPMTNQAAGQFAGVSISGSDALFVDYARVTNQSGIIIPVITESQQLKQDAANLYLRNCSGVDQSQNYSVQNRLDFGNVRAYCNRISNTADHQDNPGYCTFKDLQEVVMVNPTCYLEAYTYCINVTYLKTAGFTDSGLATLTNTGEVLDLEVESTGGDGAGICASTLGISVVASKQALPFMNVVWSLMVDYWVYLLVFIVAIIIIGGMGGGGQDGG